MEERCNPSQTPFELHLSYTNPFNSFEIECENISSVLIKLQINWMLWWFGNRYMHIYIYIHIYIFLFMCMLLQCISKWTRKNCEIVPLNFMETFDIKLMMTWLTHRGPVRHICVDDLSSFVQIMACHLIGAKLFLNQCWLIVNWTNLSEMWSIFWYCLWRKHVCKCYLGNGGHCPCLIKLMLLSYICFCFF